MSETGHVTSKKPGKDTPVEKESIMATLQPSWKTRDCQGFTSSIMKGYDDKGAQEKRNEIRETRGVIKPPGTKLSATKEGNGILRGESPTDDTNNINEIKNEIMKIESLYPEDIASLGATWQLSDKMLSNQEEELSYLRFEIINLQAMIFKNISMKAKGVSETIQKMIIQIEDEWNAIRKARYHSTVEGCLVTAGRMCTRKCFENIVNGKNNFKMLAEKLMNETSSAKDFMLQCDLKFSAILRYKWIKRVNN